MNSTTAERVNPSAAVATDIGRLILTEAEAAKLLCLSRRTLQRMRIDGGGPRYIKMGRRLGYTKADLVTWVEARGATSTSQAA